MFPWVPALLALYHPSFLSVRWEEEEEEEVVEEEVARGIIAYYQYLCSNILYCTVVYGSTISTCLLTHLLTMPEVVLLCCLRTRRPLVRVLTCVYICTVLYAYQTCLRIRSRLLLIVLTYPDMVRTCK